MKYLLFFSLLSFSYYSHGEEELDLVLDEDLAKVVENLSYNDLVLLYLSESKIADKEEIAWQATDPDYQNIRKNEFEYQKVKAKKIEESKSILENIKDPKHEFNLEVNFQLGEYDFKKGHFPVDAIEKDRHIGIFDRKSNLFKEEEIFSGNFEKKWPKVPDIGKIKILGLDKIKNIKLDKDAAEKIITSLPSRMIECRIAFNQGKVKRETKKFGKYEFSELKGQFTFSHGQCFYGFKRSDVAFEF